MRQCPIVKDELEPNFRFFTKKAFRPKSTQNDTSNNYLKTVNFELFAALLIELSSCCFDVILKAKNKITYVTLRYSLDKGLRCVQVKPSLDVSNKRFETLEQKNITFKVICEQKREEE